MNESLNLDMISAAEQEMIDFARLNYSGYDSSIDSICNLGYYLRYWLTEKQELFRLFGGKELILKKKFLEERGYDQMCPDMGRFWESSQFCTKYQDFTWTLRHGSSFNAAGAMRDAWLQSETPSVKEWAQNYAQHLSRLHGMMTVDRLVSNAYNGAEIILPKEDGSGVFKIPTGMKMIKALARIVKAYPSMELETDFEEFRLGHSRILNQKTVEGMLCLSIHPLDFITMSDNDCGWESCMSWFNGGDYRAGTVEMMNSPMVVCAYLESQSDMPYGSGRWNSKKWRQLFIVQESNITAIRSYPYYNEQVTFACLDWLRELAKENWGYEYMDNLFELKNHSVVSVTPYLGVRARIECNLMYNDFCHSHHWTVISTAFANEEVVLLDFNYSGPCICSECGEEMSMSGYDFYYGNSTILCMECSNVVQCQCCGDPVAVYNARRFGDEYYCECCYEDNASCCSVCEEPLWLSTDNYTELRLVHGERWISSAFLCEDCVDKYLTGEFKSAISLDRYGDKQILTTDLPGGRREFVSFLCEVFNVRTSTAESFWEECHPEAERRKWGNLSKKNLFDFY